MGISKMYKNVTIGDLGRSGYFRAISGLQWAAGLIITQSTKSVKLRLLFLPTTPAMLDIKSNNLCCLKWSNYVKLCKGLPNRPECLMLHMSGGENTYYSPRTWPKWVVPYRLWRFSHKFEHPKSTPYYYFSLALSLLVTHMMISKIPAEVPASQVLAEGTRWITALFTARVASGTPKCNEWVVWKMLSCWLSPLANVESAFATTAHQHPSKSTHNNQRQTHTQDPWYHWIGLKENLRETLVFQDFPMKYECFLQNLTIQKITLLWCSSKSLPQKNHWFSIFPWLVMFLTFLMFSHGFSLGFPGFSHGFPRFLASWAPGTCAAAAAAWPSLWNGPGRSSAPGLRREAWR